MTQQSHTAKLIIDHMQLLGPNARVLLVAKNKKALDDRENGIIHGKLGLFTLFRDEFSAVRPNIRVTHAGGGYITVTNAERVTMDLMRGTRFTLAVFEGIDRSSSVQVSMLIYDVEHQLLVGPYDLVFSKDGYVVNVEHPMKRINSEFEG